MLEDEGKEHQREEGEEEGGLPHGGVVVSRVGLGSCAPFFEAEESTPLSLSSSLLLGVRPTGKISYTRNRQDPSYYICNSYLAYGRQDTN